MDAIHAKYDEVLSEYELNEMPGTKREKEVAKLLAWGGTYRQVAILLRISTSTVDNTIKKFRERIGLNSVSEITPWWFCNAPRVPFENSPLKKFLGLVLFLAMLPNFIDTDIQAFRQRNGKTKAPAARAIRKLKRQ